MELDFDNVTTCEICCVFEWWLEVQQSLGAEFCDSAPLQWQQTGLLVEHDVVTG